MVIAGRLLLLNSRISLQLLLVTIAGTATGSTKSLGLRLSSKLLLLQQQVRGRRGEEGNSLLEGWRELSSVTKGWGTTEGILRHAFN